MNKKKIKILFFNKNTSGVNYFRTLTPAIHLDKNYQDEFEVHIDNDFDPTTEESLKYLKTFDIIHYHTSLTMITSVMMKITNELRNSGVKLIMDIDDYWELDRTHPKYNISKEKKTKDNIIANLKMADFVTTTTEFFKDEIVKITGKDNVIVLPNAVDPDTMPQFKDDKSNKYNDIVKIMYLGGSTHKKDVEQLEGVANMLNADPQTKNKFMFINVGWDMRGEKTETIFNDDLRIELTNMGLWNQRNVNKIVNSRGNVSRIDFIPSELKEKYKDNVFSVRKVKHKPQEIPYYYYETVFTDNYRIIDDSDYLKWLKTYSNKSYNDEKKYARRWTRPVEEYAFNLDDADIVIAPLLNTKFNNMKSPLKMVESWSRKLPVVANDVIPYNVDGVHMQNCLLVPNKPNNKKHWYKNLKKLIIDKELRNNIGETFYNDFSKKYHLNTVNNNRVEFYKNVINE